MKIDTFYDPKPVPGRQFDWEATFEGYDAGDPVGYGATEQEAVQALLDTAGMEEVHSGH